MTSLYTHWKCERIAPRLFVPNAGEEYDGEDLVQAVPRPLKWLAYRTAKLPQMLTERRLLASVREFDAVYALPDLSLRALRRIKRQGSPIILERVNCSGWKARQLLEPEYRRLGVAPQHPFHKWAVEQERAAINLADFIFCPSPHVEHSFLDMAVPREKMIPTSYGWSPERFPGAGLPREPRANATVIFVGYICVRKGAHLLLRAWERAGIAGRLILCGPVEPALAGLLRTALARSDVLHFSERRDVGPVYSEADIFALPTFEEGGPLVTYEAMAHGLPVITSPMGAGSILRDGVDGIVLPPHDVDGWVNALRSVATSDALRRRLGDAARERAQDFTWAKVAGRRADALLTKLGRSCSCTLDAGARPIAERPLDPSDQALDSTDR